MVRAAASTDIEPPGVGSLAIDLTGILRAGAVYDGRPVRRVVIEWEGGRFESDLPATTEEAESGRKLLILETLKASDSPMTRKALATALGLSSTKGRFGLEVSRMVDTKAIFERSGYVTDDVSKFPTDG
jgi:hypothetical protein